MELKGTIGKTFSNEIFSNSLDGYSFHTGVNIFEKDEIIGSIYQKENGNFIAMFTVLKFQDKNSPYKNSDIEISFKYWETFCKKLQSKINALYPDFHTCKNGKLLKVKYN